MTLTTSLMIAIPIFSYIALQLYLQREERIISEKLFNEFDKSEMVGMNTNANFFGFKSKGVTQIKGRGVMLLTEDELIFEKLITNKRFSISVDSIEEVEKVDSFLGKTKGKPLLQIKFKNKDNEIDYCAWHIDDLEQWQNDLSYSYNFLSC